MSNNFTTEHESSGMRFAERLASLRKLPKQYTKSPLTKKYYDKIDKGAGVKTLEEILDDVSKKKDQK